MATNQSSCKGLGRTEAIDDPYTTQAQGMLTSLMLFAIQLITGPNEKTIEKTEKCM